MYDTGILQLPVRFHIPYSRVRHIDLAVVQ